MTRPSTPDSCSPPTRSAPRSPSRRFHGSRARGARDGAATRRQDPGRRAGGRRAVGNTNTTGKSRMMFRLNADGSLDPSFDVGNAFSSTTGVVNAIALRPDGKIVIGGAFLYAGPVHQRSGVARLNGDGAVDPSFVLPPGQFFDGPSNNGGTTPGGVNTLALQSDGRIVITGLFGRVGTAARGIVARLEADGAFDPGFNAPNPSTGIPSSRLAGLSVILAIGVLDGDQLVVAGYLTDAVTGQAFPFARLDADARDGTFSTAVGRGQISGGAAAQALAVQSDGKIVVGGGLLQRRAGNPSFVARSIRMARSTRPTSPAPTRASPRPAAASRSCTPSRCEANDEAIIAGDFDFFDGAPAEEIVRLNTDGGRDPAFDSGAGNEGRVLALARQPDGKILVGVFADASSRPAGTAPRTPQRRAARRHRPPGTPTAAPTRRSCRPSISRSSAASCCSRTAGFFSAARSG
ncbi:MAG: delta-60 repeat domain-containing protein [Candidatus Binatia bacterium]